MLSDFRQLVKPPYLLITTLRDPLELYVSSQQFMHREDTATLEEATAFLANKMEQRMGYASRRPLPLKKDYTSDD